MFEGYFEQKRKQLGMDRADVLTEVQRTLDGWYPGQTRVQKLHRGVLRIITPNSSVAGDLRMRQLELMRLHQSEEAARKIERLQISIASLR